MARLQGKVAVILGASDERSMGYATARRFVEEGAKVVLAARRGDRAAALAEQLGGIGMACDITREDDLARLAATARDTFGKLDVAVNYSGIDVSEPILESTAEGLRKSAEVHFIGTTLFIKHMGLAMTDGGSIITASSLTVLAQAPGYAAYAGAKAGADAVVRIAANELGERGIRVNSIAPGFTKSAMTEAYFAMEAVTGAFAKEIPLGKFVVVEDIAEAALWLAAEAGSTTGQRIDVTGGQSLRRVPLPADFG
ncbi:SDR family NAD(P)-dependent oxidoreductase [Novosphingobium sp. Leaf2]|uniref:SDR family NAD(P)-dependent oxidoreductase n=1 Tax=Novosphingobium sp. Leaf2 TaxID=1735670 RepID=UPI0006F40E49|nr:SDR family oxidoreductase [Novosphingobium sp. Leaf2]KQM18248.1 epimerase [Novosphingobium sp. Leaf2]